MHPPALQFADHVFPALAAILFIVVMSFVREPARRSYNAILVAGAGSAYLAGGFGPWEVVYMAVAGGVVAYLGLGSYRWIGLGWLMHSCWDVMHHLYGNPLWPFMPTSSWGCMIFDAIIGVWFLAGAPAVHTLVRRSHAAAEAPA
ncbi:DUF6010 family protein [Haliangium sp.]|uniref:DUF6010 family protein n=1 Tax=Haliangium sp. TaxID=2663208 RepID=UPI003D0F1CA1